MRWDVLLNQLIATSTATEDVHTLLSDFLPSEKYYRMNPPLTNYIAIDEKDNTALNELKQPPYPLQQQKDDKEYVLKKWDMAEQEFDEIMGRSPVPQEIYGYDKISFWPKLKVRLFLIYLYKFAYPLGLRKRPAK